MWKDDRQWLMEVNLQNLLISPLRDSECHRPARHNMGRSATAADSSMFPSKQLTTVSIIISLLIVHAAALAQTSSDPDVLLPDPREMARVEAAVDRALEYLLRKQNPDGSWPSGKGINNGINAICLLAFLGRGHLPGRGPYRPVVDRTVSFILATQQPNGLYKSPSGWNGVMYEHGLCTLAMIESYGGAPSDGMRNSVQKAVDLIVKVQSPLGGWRYHPKPADADLSVTVMQVVALRAAQNARLNVPKKTIENALKYVKSCAVGNGGFSYQPGGGANYAQSAAGSLSMQLLGAFNDPSVEKALGYLEAASLHPKLEYLWYSTYYAMQSHFQAGGGRWQSWHPKVRDFVLKIQRENGSWPAWKEPYGGPTECYSTAFGAMTLEVYMHYLPAYQR